MVIYSTIFIVTVTEVILARKVPNRQIQGQNPINM